MKNNFSRRDFLRGAAASAATVAAAGLVGGAALAEGGEAIYTPGTYTATAQGMGDVTVTMTFDETTITDVLVDVSNEMPNIGQLHGETLKDALLALQSSDIDSISGATLTSNAVKTAAANCIAQAMGVEVAEEEGPMMGPPGGKVVDGIGWQNAPDPIPDSDIAETYDTDVVVVGHGYAGLNACRYLASQGIAVTLIESQAEESYSAMGNEAGTPNAKALLDRGVPEIDPIEY